MNLLDSLQQLIVLWLMLLGVLLACHPTAVRNLTGHAQSTTTVNVLDLQPKQGLSQLRSFVAEGRQILYALCPKLDIKPEHEALPWAPGPAVRATG